MHTFFRKVSHRISSLNKRTKRRRSLRVKVLEIDKENLVKKVISETPEELEKEYQIAIELGAPAC